MIFSIIYRNGFHLDEIVFAEDWNVNLMQNHNGLTNRIEVYYAGF